MRSGIGGCGIAKFPSGWTCGTKIRIASTPPSTPRWRGRMSETDMTDYAELETPLGELLERVPEDARAWYEHGPTNHSHIPYGLLCRRAAAEIRSLTIKLDQLLNAETMFSGRMNQVRVDDDA